MKMIELMFYNIPPNNYTKIKMKDSIIVMKKMMKLKDRLLVDKWNLIEDYQEHGNLKKKSNRHMINQFIGSC